MQVVNYSVANFVLVYLFQVYDLDQLLPPIARTPSPIDNPCLDVIGLN